MLLRFIIQIKLSPSPKVEEDIIMRQKIINQEHGKKKKNSKPSFLDPAAAYLKHYYQNRLFVVVPRSDQLKQQSLFKWKTVKAKQQPLKTIKFD